MTLDKSDHPYPWHVVSSWIQDLQTVAGLQMPLQLMFPLPASRFSFQLKSLSVKQLFALAGKKKKKCCKHNYIVRIKEVKGKKRWICGLFWYVDDCHVLIKNNIWHKTKNSLRVPLHTCLLFLKTSTNLNENGRSQTILYRRTNYLITIFCVLVDKPMLS